MEIEDYRKQVFIDSVSCDAIIIDKQLADTLNLIDRRGKIIWQTSSDTGAKTNGVAFNWNKPLNPPSLILSARSNSYVLMLQRRQLITCCQE